MREWFREWFDADYAALYAHRDVREAARAVEGLLRVAPGFREGPVLDLGCGAGRHLEVLRQHNPQAFGVDLSESLLALAPPALGPFLLRADMRRLPLREGLLAGVCLWFSTFGYFDEAANRALLARLQALLRPGGLLLLDVPNAPALRRGLVEADTWRRGELWVANRRSLEGARLVKRMRLARPGRPVREAMESLRLYEPAELRGLAREAGLSVAAEWGDYGFAPFREPDSARWIGLLKKA